MKLDEYTIKINDENVSNKIKILRIFISFLILSIGCFIYNYFTYFTKSFLIIPLLLIISIIIGLTTFVKENEESSGESKENDFSVATVYGMFIGFIGFFLFLIPSDQLIPNRFMTLCFGVVITAISCMYSFIIVQ
jgi:hypothetical protein